MNCFFKKLTIISQQLKLLSKNYESQICIIGAAADVVSPGVLVIILAYSGIDGSQIDGHSPRVVHVDEGNRLTHTL